MFNKQGFTLIEILIAIAILILLSVSVIVILNPIEYLKDARDSQRLEDLTKLNKAITWFQADTQGKEFMGTSSVIYTSLPDSNPNCQSWNLPAPTSGWSYNCVSPNNLQKIDGTGWIPINFKKLSFGQTLNKLPIDPLNNSTAYYTYVYDPSSNNFELNSILESSKKSFYLKTDGGDNDNIYEIGSKLILSPVGISNQTPSQNQINGILKIIGSSSTTDIGYDFVNTSDSGFIIVGQTYNGPFGSSDILLIKLDNNFNILWKKILGTSSSEFAKKIIKNINNNYFVFIPGWGAGSIIIEINENGDILNSKIINISSGDLYCRSMIMSSDYKYVLACNNSNNIYLIKLNYDLSFNWGRYLTTGFNMSGFDVKERQNGNLVIVGTRTNVIVSVIFGEYSSSGDYIRGALFDSSYSIYPYSLIILDDDSIIIGGLMYNGSAQYSFISKINSTLNSSLWTKIFNGSNNEHIESLFKISGNQYLAIGHTRYNGYGILIMRLDSNGNILSSKKIGSTTSDFGMQIKKIDDFYYFIGRFYYSNTDVIFGKINSDLNINSCSIINDYSNYFISSSISYGSGPYSYNVNSLNINNFSFSETSGFNLLENNQCQN